MVIYSSPAFGRRHSSCRRCAKFNYCIKTFSGRMSGRRSRTFGSYSLFILYRFISSSIYILVDSFIYCLRLKLLNFDLHNNRLLCPPVQHPSSQQHGSGQIYHSYLIHSAIINLISVWQQKSKMCEFHFPALIFTLP